MADFSEEFLQQGAEGMATPNTDDLRAYAAVVTAMNLGIVLLHEHLARRLGADPLTEEGYPRVGLALLDIHSDVLLSPEVIAKARVGLARMRAGSPVATTFAERGDDD
jgi:hypothetical protein